MKKVISLFLALCILLSVTGCKKAGDIYIPELEYTVTVHSMGDMPLEGIIVYIYDGDALISFGQTDQSGAYRAVMPQNPGYSIRLEGVPRGYAKADAYAFTGAVADIRLTSSLIQGEDLGSATLGLGDVMYDFSVVTAGGETVTLSQLLQEKDMVLINFFYTTCGPCANEFPFMQQASDQFPQAGVIALDPLEDNSTVSLFQSTMGLTFPMAACPASWAQTFGLVGYPTSVVVDRYGVICLIEIGGITSLRPFTVLFDTFCGEDYTQKLYGSLSDMITNTKPTYTMPDTLSIEATFQTDMYNIHYRAEEGEDGEYAWPFIEDTKLGVRCMKPSNQGIENSYAILYADVYLEAGQAISFDYLSSSEQGCDVLYILVDRQDVLAISGYDQEEVWRTCYPWVAEESRTYEIALCYTKDGDTNTADDTVYLSNLCIGPAEEIDVPSYIPRQAAKTADGYSYTYCDIFYNEADGYYHVDSADGPLLLADLMGYTQFSEETNLWDIVYNSTVTLEGKPLYDAMIDYFSYSSNSALYGVAPVDQTLMEYLQLVDQHHGFDDSDPNEWLKACRYYAAYGTDQQLADPTAGLSTASAYTAKLGKNVDTNYFYYDRPLMPRGLLARFTPDRSGVYKITSHMDSPNDVEAWIFTGEDRQNMYTYTADQRLLEDDRNCYMYYYMEAGQDYYIDIAFWDIYETGYIYYDIEYVGRSYDLFRLASPGYFTYDTNATGDQMYDIISGGIDVVLGDDGIYYHDLGNGEKGSKLYCDFTGLNGLFSAPIATVQTTDAQGETVTITGLIDKGAFDFSKTEQDQYILGILAQHGGDTAAADAYLKTYWGEDYQTYAQQYRIDDVFAGIYHGSGEDCTQAISAYLDEMIRSPAERKGCVVVTRELAELLQLLMDGYTFGGVENSWTKLCYYYDHLGPN